MAVWLSLVAWLHVLQSSVPKRNKRHHVGGGKPLLRHHVSSELFCELARGAGSPPTIRYLWDTQRSRRMALLRALYVEMARDPEFLGPLKSSALAAWGLLDHALSTAPAQFNAVLMYPQVGNWLSYTLRRHRGGAKSDAPLYADSGQITAFALACAAVTGNDYSTLVPVASGRVMLPGLGLAHFAKHSPWDIAEASTSGDRVRLHYGGQTIEAPVRGGDDIDGWWPLRRIAVGGAPQLTLWLDDLHPMRDLADPVAPHRLAAGQVDQWTHLLGEAWQILVEHHPETADALAVGVTSLVPLTPNDGWDSRSASSGDAFGAVLCSLPPDAMSLAVALAHEFMHIKLGALMHLTPLTEGADTPAHYAPWRDDPRPLGGLIQGIYAFFGIASFWRRHVEIGDVLERRLASFEYGYARLQTGTGLTAARATQALTLTGRRFLDGLHTQLMQWEREPIDESVETLVFFLSDTHRISWCIRHRRPASDEIIEFCTAWWDGSCVPIATKPFAIQADVEGRHWSQGRLGLARRRILAPDRYADSLQEVWAASMTEADLALFAGDLDRARGGFNQQIQDAPHAAADAWAGLAVTLDRTEPAAAALHDRPDLVSAVYQRLRNANFEPLSPIAVAHWVGTIYKR